MLKILNILEDVERFYIFINQFYLKKTLTTYMTWPLLAVADIGNMPCSDRAELLINKNQKGENVIAVTFIVA